MTINCVSFVIFFKYFAKRSTLLSSSAASISSRRQNGEGFKFWIAKRSEMAVSAFSPPDNCIMFCSFFPGGCAIIRMPASNMSSSSISSSVAFPPPKSSLNTTSNSSEIFPNCSRNCFLMESSSSSMIFTSVFSASTKSSCCAVRNVYRSETCLYSSIAPTLTSPSFLIVSLTEASCFFNADKSVKDSSRSSAAD